MDRNTKAVFTYAGVLFAISFTAFIISMCVGWWFVERIDRTNDLMFSAAVVIAFASSAVLGLIWILARVVYTGAESKLGTCIVLSSVILVFISGLLSAIAGVMFLTASLITKVPGVVGYGVPAGGFALFSGVTCCIGMCCCFAGIKDRYIDAIAFAWNGVSETRAIIQDA